MNNFIFSYPTKVYFGKGCVKEYLACLTRPYNTVMLAYGGGSIKKNGVYDEVAGILAAEGKTVVDFPGIMPNPTYAKVQEGAKLAREKSVDFILAVGGGSTIDCCKIMAAQALEDQDIWTMEMEKRDMPERFLPMGAIVTASGTGSEMNNGAVITNEEKKIKCGMLGASNASAMAENGILKTGKITDFQCHQMEHQLGAYTNCNHGAGLAVLHPVYYRHIYKDGLFKFKRFATQVWGIDPAGKSDEEIAAGVEALADFIKEIGLPTTLRELGVDESIDLGEVAASCSIAPGSCKKMCHAEVARIFQEAM